MQVSQIERLESELSLTGKNIFTLVIQIDLAVINEIQSLKERFQPYKEVRWTQKVTFFKLGKQKYFAAITEDAFAN